MTAKSTSATQLFAQPGWPDPTVLSMLNTNRTSRKEVFKGTSDVFISLNNRQALLSASANPKLSLTPYAKDKFFFDNASIIGEMNRDMSMRVGPKPPAR